MADQIRFLSDADVAAIRSLLRWRSNLKVSGALLFTNTADGANIVIPPRPPPVPAGQPDGRWGIVQSTEREGTDFRWTTVFKWAGPKTDTRWDGWAALSGDENKQAYNTYEVPNTTGATVYGNGVTAANLPDGFELQPPPVGLPIWVRTRMADGDDGPEPEYWFEYANGVDGTCPEGGG